jgi:protein translocase SecG subunit
MAIVAEKLSVFRSLVHFLSTGVLDTGFIFNHSRLSNICQVISKIAGLSLFCYDYPVSPMAATLHSLQLITGIILIVFILLQRTSGDTGSNFGDNMSAFQTRRGVERLLFVSTIIVAIVFVVASIWVVAIA